jgi:cell division transport system permease protein
MLARLSYILRETLASFRRNMTLTVAAIITAAVSLLIFGLTLFMQHGFDNLVSKWQDGAEMIMYFNQPLSADQQAEIEAALNGQPQAIDRFEYCDPDCAYALAQKLFAGDPTTLARLSPESIPVLYKIFPTDDTTVDDLKNLQASLSGLPQLRQFETNEGTFDVISKLKGFVGLYTVILSIALLIAAVLLIWNTIRTAMFARRREIEVMKLVGATDWFIRIPFMLEGLIQGLLGALGACAGLWVINNRWTAGVRDFPENSGLASMVVESGFSGQVMVLLLVIGMVVGAVGAGIAASRFLDV